MQVVCRDASDYYQQELTLDVEALTLTSGNNATNYQLRYLGGYWRRQLTCTVQLATP
jgi:hypothetical protein